MITQALISQSTLPPKFIRRNDLTVEIRSALILQAYEAQRGKYWGVISELSRQYKVSRTFIYTLLSVFKKEVMHLFFPKEKTEPLSKEACEAYILVQRFEGKSSIDAISTIMKRLEMPFSSVGFISQFLTHVGEVLPNTLENKYETKQLVVFASDEVFAKSVPLLITVEPISSVILRIELADQRTADIWSNHFQSIQDNGFQAKLLTSDAGTGLCAAHKDTLSDIPWQLDTFHGIAHRLGDWVRRLEKTAYVAIKTADERKKNWIRQKRNGSLINA